MSRFHICGITTGGEIENVRELLSPLDNCYDALQWVWHGNHEDASRDSTYLYLDSHKKDGKIIITDWCYRFDFSRNHFLYQGNIKHGEWFCILDSMERLSPTFFEKWPQLRNILENNNIDGLQLYGKKFLYKFNDFLEFRGNPHDGLFGANKVIELTQINGFQDTSWFWGSVRSIKRDRFNYIWHYVNYYVNCPNSNHCLLGLESNPDREKIFRHREVVRQKFRLYCHNLGLLPLTIEKFKDLSYNRLEEIKYFINEEKILNDAYYFLSLKKSFGQEDMESAHDLDRIVKI